jgi:Family of unknown function (DUF6384)
MNEQPSRSSVAPEIVAVPAALPAPRPTTLDDLMIAMDVVDTVRHRDELVQRELNETGREAELIERLKEIYRQQGIEVPDSVLAEGVKALKDSRFIYTPPPPGLKRTLFTLWVQRGRYGAIAAVAITALLGTCGIQYATVTRPAAIAAEEQRIELTETLPKAIRQAHADVIAVATGDPVARERATALLADGDRAIRDGDRAEMTRIAADLKTLRDAITQDYTLMIVSRQGETTGVWRRPPGGVAARNHYLVVEAIAPDGRRLKLPVRNEENGQTETVDKFGVRVPQAVYDAVAVDKRDDGIIQKNRFAVKRRGVLTPEFLMPFEGGYITRW